jgi:hypothetical protein
MTHPPTNSTVSSTGTVVLPLSFYYFKSTQMTGQLRTLSVATWLLVAMLVPSLESSQGSLFRICNSSLEEASFDLEVVGCNAASPAASCSATMVPICIQNVQTTRGAQVECLGLCQGDDFLVTVTWDYSSSWMESCANGTSDDVYHQRCERNDDCRTGSCCSLPSAVTVQDRSLCAVLPDCSSIRYGTCIDSSTSTSSTGSTSDSSDVRPGYSCATNDPCLDSQDWAERTCGYHRPTNTFTSPRKRCSDACSKAISRLRGCPNLEDMVETFDNYKDCDRCGDYFYQRCQDASDCPVGYCCSLPPNEVVPGFFDETTCGPPSQCGCSFMDVDSNSFTETISCSEDCGARDLGTCQEIGTRSTYNPVYECDCSDPATLTRTESPTALPILTAAPSTVPTSATPAIPTTAAPTPLAMTPAPFPGSPSGPLQANNNKSGATSVRSISSILLRTILVLLLYYYL